VLIAFYGVVIAFPKQEYACNAKYPHGPILRYRLQEYLAEIVFVAKFGEECRRGPPSSKIEIHHVGYVYEYAYCIDYQKYNLYRTLIAHRVAKFGGYGLHGDAQYVEVAQCTYVEPNAAAAYRQHVGECDVLECRVVHPKEKPPFCHIQQHCKRKVDCHYQNGLPSDVFHFY
jgi:hypothetical protein